MLQRAACQQFDSQGSLQRHGMKMHCKVTGDSVRSSQDDNWFCIIESEAILYCCDQRLVSLAWQSLGPGDPTRRPLIETFVAERGE